MVDTPMWCASSAISYPLATMQVCADVLAVAPCLRCRMQYMEAALIVSSRLQCPEPPWSVYVCVLFVAAGHACV